MTTISHGTIVASDERRPPSKPIPTSATLEQLVDHYNSQLIAYNCAIAGRIPTEAPQEIIEDLSSVTKDRVIELIRKQNHRLQRYIRPRATELLQAVVKTDPNGRTVGYTYSEILDILIVEFPEASTSAACLRWYVVHLWSEADEEGLPRPKMPQVRPRSAARRVVRDVAA